MPQTGGIGGRDNPGLRRLEAVLEKQLDRGKRALPLPWRETILEPDTARLVWWPRTLRSPAGAGGYRVALDPPTRWYYIAWTGAAGGRLTFYGPLEESAKGSFVDALTAATPTATASQESDQEATKPAGKGKTGTKSNSKSNTKANTRSAPKAR
ncbi:MAG: hypothetical protein M9915_09765 [Rhizobacter sp.]|nr:hypothetical protein [Rhizobacter sp.]